MFRKSNAWKDWKIIIDSWKETARQRHSFTNVSKWIYENIQNVEMNKENQKTEAEHTIFNVWRYLLRIFMLDSSWHIPFKLLQHLLFILFFSTKSIPIYMYVLFIRLLFAIYHTRTLKLKNRRVTLVSVASSQ